MDTLAMGRKKKPEGPRQVGVNVKMTAEWRDWLNRAATHCGLSVSSFLEQSARKYARAEGFVEKPPER